MSDKVNFDVRLVPAGTGSVVWDSPSAMGVINRFMPQDRALDPMVGILYISKLRPTPTVLKDAVVSVGEDVRAGRYGNFSFFVSSEDDATRQVIGDIAASQNVAVYLTSSLRDFSQAEPAGKLTLNDLETLNLVQGVGGTVTVVDFALQVEMEKTAAGNRLSSLHQKGYLHRVQRPHPAGDLYVDPRSLNPGYKEP